MPYKVVGKCVYVKRKTRWAKLKCYRTHAQAIKYMQALNIHVHHKSRK